MMIFTASARRIRILLLLVSIITFVHQVGGSTTAIWPAPISGNWTDAARWSTDPQYPNDFSQPGVTYDVLIDAVGSPYTINTTPLMGLQSLTLSSPDATILISSDLTVPTIVVNSGAFLLNGSTFRNSTISAPAGSMPFTVIGNSTMSNAALGAGLAINPNAALTLRDIRPFSAGSISLTGAANNALVFVNAAGGAASLGGTGQIVFDGSSSNNLVFSQSGSLTIGPDFVIKTGAQGGSIGSSNFALINQGVVSARTAGKLVQVYGTSVTNSGMLEARDGGILKINNLGGALGSVSLAGGSLDLSGNYNINQPINVGAGSTLTLRGNWANSGGLSIDGGTLNLATIPASHGTISPTNGTLGVIGTLTTAQLETIPYTAFPSLAFGAGANLNNTGKTLHLPAGNPTRFLGTFGTSNITGGVVDGAAGASMLVSVAAFLDTVTLNVDSDVAGNLGFKNSLTVNKPMSVSGGLVAGGQLPPVSQSAVITGSGPVILNGGRFLAGEKVSLTIDSGMTVVGANPNGGQIGGSGGITNNNGQIIAEDSSIYFTGQVVNSGLLKAVNTGWLENVSPMTNNATITIDATSSYTTSSTFTSNAGTIGGAGKFYADAPTTIGGPQNWQAGASMNSYRDTLHLDSNAGTRATAQAPASANLNLSVAGSSGKIVLGADQDLHSLQVAYWYSPDEGFDLNSPTAPGGFRSVRVYDPATTARSALYDYIVHANGPGATSGTNGIFDSGLSAHPNSLIGLARLPDEHGDVHWLIRPTRIGDLNLDGAVSIADFITLSSHFGMTNAIREDGDINYDRTVTIADFLLMAANFNTTYSGKSFPVSDSEAAQLTTFAAANVPEPSIAAVIFAAGLLLRRRAVR